MAFAIDCAVVDEYILSAFLRNEAKTLGIVEPFHSAGYSIRHN